MYDMERLKMKSFDNIENNVKKIEEIFPNCVKESKDNDGKVVKVVDFDLLKQELSNFVVEGREERYQFTWPDKKSAILTANSQISKTLRPNRNESVNYDGTENLYIEGDNLDVLKVLQETYLGRVKMIYIDPPYNTGKDSFVYNDNRQIKIDDYTNISGTIDDEGNMLFDIRVNNESNGRFHSDWLNMIYPRLKVAKDLLREDGVIFISIDDNEVHDLRKVCDEIFGETNFVGCAGRISKKANNQGDYWAPNFDYLLTYTRNRSMAVSFFGGINYDSYNLVEESGERKGEKYQLVRLYMTSLDPMRGCTNQRYFIECPDGSFVIPPGDIFPEEVKDASSIPPKSGKDKVWRWTYSSYLDKKDQIVIEKRRSSNLVNEKGEETKWNVFTKTYLNDVIKKSTATPNSFIEDHINQNASHELKKLDIPFTFAKPTSFIKYLMEVSRVDTDDIVLDFFSGSASTGDALMQYQLETKKKPKFILVQLPEACDEDSDSFKQGYETISDIGKERLRRAGKQYLEENEAIDYGFRVLECDSSNMKDIYYNPVRFEQASLDDVVDNIKDDRSSEDLLFQIMLELGIQLSSSITCKVIEDKNIYNVDDGYLIACFDNAISEKIIEKVAKEKPYYFVMRDYSLSDDNVATNFEQIFSMYSPGTIRKIL